MLNVGITGGIGAGKSIVCKCFELLNIPIYNADFAAKKLMSENPDLKIKLKENFGDEVFLSNLNLNKTYLAEIIFNNEDQLNLLNSLVHPFVANDFSLWKKSHPSAPYLIREAAILFESGTWKDLDFIILVDAPIELRIQRVKLRDHRSEAIIQAIIDRQWNSEKKRNLADAIIENDNHHLVLPQVINLHSKFLNYGS